MSRLALRGIFLVLISLGIGAAATAEAVPAFSAPVWLRVIGTGIGTLLVIYGLFTVPTDQKRWENYLVRWWVWIEGKRESGLHWQTAFLQVVTVVTTIGFDRVFGPRLLSWEAAGASIGLAMGSLFLGLFAIYLHDFSDIVVDILALLFGCLFAFVGLIRIFRPKLVRYQPQAALCLLFFFFLVAIVADHLTLKWHTVSYEEVRLMESILVALSASLLTDVFFVSLMRLLLRYALTGSGFVSLLIICTNLLVAGAVSIGPAYVASTSDINSMGAFGMGFFQALALMNVFDTLAAAVVVVLGVIMLLHRLIWPPISRLLQVMGDEHILLKRWPLFFGGVSVLAATWPPLGLIARYLGLKLN